MKVQILKTTFPYVPGNIVEVTEQVADRWIINKIARPAPEPGEKVSPKLNPEARAKKPLDRWMIKTDGHGMTVKQLQAIASESGIDVSGLKKPEIIERLLAGEE